MQETQDVTQDTRPKAEPSEIRTPRPRRRTTPKGGEAGQGGTTARQAPHRWRRGVALLRRKNGATIAEMVTRFGLLPPRLRAIISVEGRKRGLKVELVSKAHCVVA